MADVVDRELETAETDASGHGATATGEPIERRESMQSASTSTDGEEEHERGTAIDQIPTQREVLSPVEKVETAMSRIHTQSLQHTTTVGSGIRSRQRESRRPLPAMGAGKPYPPALPEREEYVVEFDGADDPMHAQNWTMKRKQVYPLCSYGADKIGSSRLVCWHTPPSLQRFRAASSPPPYR
jgi:DHA1 family multidrug resistance protein-like MFS transporter